MTRPSAPQNPSVQGLSVSAGCIRKDSSQMAANCKQVKTEAVLSRYKFCRVMYKRKKANRPY